MESNVNGGIAEVQAASTDTISFTVSKTDSTWARYGLYEKHLNFGAPGSYRDSGYKAIVRGTDPRTAGNVAIVSKDYALLPNEEVKATALAAVEGTPMKLVYEGFGAHGNSLFMQYLDSGNARNPEVKVGDFVGAGFSIRNSIDGSVGFGVDGYTNRKVCGNGATKQVKAAGMHHKHTSGLEELMGDLPGLMSQAVDAALNMIAYYRQLSTVQLNDNIAKTLSSTYLPKKILPWGFDDAGKPDISELKLNPNFVNGFQWTELAHTAGGTVESIQHDLDKSSRDMWSVFNHITGGITHNTKTDPQSKNLYNGALMQAMERVIAPVVA